MSDPWRIFKADQGRQNTLKVLWPDLYECLADLDTPGRSETLRCALGAHPLGKGPPAVARVVDQYGPPACRGCIDKVHGPGHAGWPLRRERLKR